jgi:hypothetical protein
MKTILAALLAFITFSPLPSAAISAEEKQKQMEEALVKSADATKSDLTRIQCGNLVYATNRSSVCFADAFLGDVAKQTSLDVGKSFVPVKAESESLFDFPFLIWSGQDSFNLTQKERDNLRKYLTNGGFILSSPGCSDTNWDKSLRRELQLIFPDKKLDKIPMTHPLFSTALNIPRLTDKGGKAQLVEGLEINGRLVMVYSREGLNDVKNAKGCCCCGGNEIMQAAQVNLNALVYALLY